MSDSDDHARKLDYNSTHVSNDSRDVADRSVPSHRDVEDGRRTDFDPSDATDSEKYRHLRRKWDELDSEGNTERRDADKQRLVSIISSQCGYTNPMRERFSYLTDELDFQEDVHRQASLEEIVLALGTLIANEQGWWIRREDEYEELRRGFDIPPKRVKLLRKCIQETDTYTAQNDV
jgi:hypothetical protein